jgi:hypothetical protein
VTHGFTVAFGYSAAVFAVATVVVGLLVRATKHDVAAAAPVPELEPELELVAG